MPTDEWERGFAAGYRAARDPQSSTIKEVRKERLSSPKPKKKRKASAYNKKYAKAYKALKKKHPRTSFAALAKKAHVKAKRMK